MNLEGKIDLIKQAVQLIKQAILSKGQTPSGNLSTYADAIGNIPTPNNQSKTVTTNGVVRYDEGYTGLEQVTVNVQPSLQSKSVVANGTVTPDNNYYGLSSVTVNVPIVLDDLIDGTIDEVDTSVTSIRSNAFSDCQSLDTLVLRANNLINLYDLSILKNTAIANKEEGSGVYVKESLLNEYKDNYNLGFETAEKLLDSSSSKQWVSIISNDTDTYYALSYQGHIAYSNDGGLNWTTSQPTNLWGHYWEDWIFANNIYVAVGKGNIAISTNGTTNWTSTAGLENFSAITYNDENFVVLTNKGKVLISSDATTWTTIDLSQSDLQLSSSDEWVGITSAKVSYNGSIQLFALSKKGYISYSSDGTSWSTPTDILGSTSQSWISLSSDGTRLVAINSGGKVALMNKYENADVVLGFGHIVVESGSWIIINYDEFTSYNQWQSIKYSTGSTNNFYVGINATGYIIKSTDLYNYYPLSTYDNRPISIE